LSWFQKSVCELDICAMPLKALREVVEGSEYADRGWASGLMERKEAAGDNACEVEYKEIRQFNAEIVTVGHPGSMIALDGEGPDQRVAIINYGPFSRCVVIYHVESGERVATAGSMGVGPGRFRMPLGIGFSGTGELYVSDFELHRISVFDRQGRYVRGFGELGDEEGKFNHPCGLCFTADGHLLVTDSDNHRVSVLRQDGTFVRSIGSLGFWEGQFHRPVDICAMPDGRIAVLECLAHRVQLFDMEGGFLRSFQVGTVSDSFTIHVGGGGEFVISRIDPDSKRTDLAIFSAGGELLQTIGPEGDSKVPREGSILGAVACTDGRLIVATQNPPRVLVLS